MLVIQIAAAVLLLLGSGLIFRAVLEIDTPTRPGTTDAPSTACGRAGARDRPAAGGLSSAC